MAVFKGRWAAASVVASITGPLFVPGQAVASPIGTPADFNGDGYRDVVLPAPAATVSGKKGAGAVVVLYGSANRVSAQRRVVITQDTAGVPGAAETGDFFGAATASADLNMDGYADLIVGAPFEDNGTTADAGAVTVLWGGRRGLSKATTLRTPVAEGARYGLDVAAYPQGRSFAHVLVGGWDGSVHYVGPFGTSATPGGPPASVQNDRSTPSLAHVVLGDLNGRVSRRSARPAPRSGRARSPVLAHRRSCCSKCPAGSLPAALARSRSVPRWASPGTPSRDQP